MQYGTRATARLNGKTAAERTADGIAAQTVRTVCRLQTAKPPFFRNFIAVTPQSD